MRKWFIVLSAVALVASFSAICQAETWDVTGNWEECFLGGGPGQPGNVINASGENWALTGAVLQDVQVVINDPLTYQSTYKGAKLELSDMGDWGFNFTAEDLEITVVHTKRECGVEETPSLYGCFFFAVSGSGIGQIEGLTADLNCTVQAAYNYNAETFGNPCEDSEGMGDTLDAASVTLDWADIVKYVTPGTPDSVIVGADFPQQFSFGIEISNLAGLGAVMFLDTIPAEFDLDPNIPPVAVDCTVETYRNKGADKGKKPKLEPEFLRIIPDEGAESCAVTVSVVTDGNPGHFDKENGIFTLYEPTSCDAGTIVLNEGVSVQGAGGDVDFQDEDGVLLTCEEFVDDEL